MKGLIVDTNLLLVYLVGCYDADYLARFSRTSGYTEKDFKKLDSFINSFQFIYVTPQILTELLYFSKEIPEVKFNKYIEVLTDKLSTFKEGYIDKKIIFKEKNNLIRFGFTDCSIIEAAKRYSCTVLTTDFPLSGSMKANNLKAINWVELLYNA